MDPLQISTRWLTDKETAGYLFMNLKPKGGGSMRVSEASKLFLEYHKSHSKENSMRAYKLVLSKLYMDFGDENLEQVTTEKVLSFLTRITEGRKQQTKRSRYSHLLAFFNFVKNNLNPEFQNPCDTIIDPEFWTTS